MKEQGDERIMRRALELAARGLGYTRANPLVGAVLVHEGRIIGEGFHMAFGGPHAEVACLYSVAAGDRALIPESVLYVTLEPCAHHGKTPPCADRIVAEGIRNVVVCNDDPFPGVNGRGYERLRNAGVAVSTGLLAAEGRWLNRRFFCAQEKQRPYIILKWAQSADGFIGPADGSRMQLSGPVSQRLNHRWRTQEQAILVGTQTAIADNPRLTPRLAHGSAPLRIFPDLEGRVPHDHHLFDGEVETWMLTRAELAVPVPVERITVVHRDEVLPAVLGRLYERGCISLIVEGGASMLAAFLQPDLWDEARIIHTPVPMGQGLRAPQLYGAKLIDSQPLGQDRGEWWVRS